MHTLQHGSFGVLAVLAWPEDIEANSRTQWITYIVNESLTAGCSASRKSLLSPKLTWQRLYFSDEKACGSYSSGPGAGLISDAVMKDRHCKAQCRT